MKKIFIIATFFIFTGIGFCEEADFKNYAGYVSDYAGILSYETKAKLTALSSEIEVKTTSQLAILTIDTTAPLDIETYAVKIFEKWGIGQKGKDNGVLMLVAVKDRQMRIEVGYGLEGAIPDALAKNIIEKSMLPFFKNGDYNAGLLQGAAVVSKLIAGEYNVEISELENIKIAASSKQPSIFDFLFILILIIIFIRIRFFWFFPMSGTGRGRGGYWHGGSSSGGFSGGFGGFGGGFSGGGGASGRW
nr:TPM domain-containing protein [Candidatus Omnitrophota bacterium]